jgi:hypothetical protein
VAAAYEVANHLRPFGDETAFATAEFLQFQLSYVLHLVLANHFPCQISYYLVAKIKIIIYLCKLKERKAILETPNCLFPCGSDAGVVLRDEVRR